MPDNNATYVQTKNTEYTKYEDKWKLIRSVIASEVTSYLRNVGANEATVPAQEARQKAYVDGAILYNFTKRTTDGMVGSTYRKQPVVELPPELEYLLTDADGNGQPLVQQSQDAVREDIMIGRLGLFVDAPAKPTDTEGNQLPVSKQMNADGLTNPKIQLYTAESIINWRVERIGSVNKLVMIVLAEEYEYQSGENEFLFLTGTQYRVLDLDNGLYRQRIWRYNDKGQLVNNNGEIDQGGTSIESFDPRANGQRMTEIPFAFIGADNNDYTIDEPPIFPLASLNIAHYRNSADNEEMLFLVSQAMLVIAPEKSIAAKWKEHNPDGVKFGARAGLNVGDGGNAFILQASADSALSTAITKKEEQAVQIGAQLITPTQQVTAESARIQRGADTSVLSSVSNNVSAGYNKAIQWCLDFLGSTSVFEFKLSNDFFFNRASPQDIDSIIKAWQGSAISTSVKDKFLVEGGVIADDVDLEEMQEDIENEAGMPDLDTPDTTTLEVETQAVESEADNA